MTTSINIDLDAIFHHITTKESLFIFSFYQFLFAEEVSSDSDGFSTRATMVCFFTIGILVP